MCWEGEDLVTLDLQDRIAALEEKVEKLEQQLENLKDLIIPNEED